MNRDRRDNKNNHLNTTGKKGNELNNNLIIGFRNGLDLTLRASVMRNNLGDKTMMMRVLNRISTYDDYDVRVVPVNEVEIVGAIIDETCNVVQIFEKGNPIFTIYRDKLDEITKLYVNPFDLMYSDQLNDVNKANSIASKMISDWNREYNTIIDILQQQEKMDKLDNNNA